jgi:hypothetical protein
MNTCVIFNMIRDTQKGGTFKMKIGTVFSIIAVFALLAALVPGVALAATEGSSSGSFACGNSAPTVDTVALVDIGDSGVTTMTPQVEYNVKVTVSDANTLDDLSTVKVWIYYDADGTFNSSDKVDPGDTQTGAIMTWTNAEPDTWAIDPSASTSWSIVEGNCSSPTLTASSGDFEFHFKPGKVATESAGASEWHIYAEADDGTATANNNQEGREMAWYGEVTVNTGSVDWESVTPGMDFGEGDPSEEGTISVTYIANGAYDEKVAASSPWSGAPSGSAALENTGSPSANEFSLKADDTGTLASAVVIDASPTYTAIDDTGTITGESGDTVTTNALWLKLGSPFTSATYTGTIYYQIADGS